MGHYHGCSHCHMVLLGQMGLVWDQRQCYWSTAILTPCWSMSLPRL